jgi:hypothetical protein
VLRGKKKYYGRQSVTRFFCCFIAIGDFKIKQETSCCTLPAIVNFYQSGLVQSMNQRLGIRVRVAI